MGALAFPAAADTVDFEFHIGWGSGPLDGGYTTVTGSYNDDDLDGTGTEFVTPEDDDLEFEFTVDGTTYDETDDTHAGDSPVFPSLKLKNGEIVSMKFDGDVIDIRGRTVAYEGTDGDSKGQLSVPEPASALLLAGAAALIALRRRRR